MDRVNPPVSVADVLQQRRQDSPHPPTTRSPSSTEPQKSASERPRPPARGADARFGIGDPNCATCGGLGYVKLDLPVHDRRFGKMIHCPACGQGIVQAARARTFESQRERIARYSSVRTDQTFDTFSLHGVSATVREAHVGALRFAGEPHGWLILHGSTGVGKTHLANAIANQRADWLVMAMVVPDFLELLKSGFDRGDYQELLDLATGVDLLVLDDLGTESSTPWAYEKLFQLLNHRYNQILPTVVVFNGRLEDLDPRIASRMRDRAVAHVYPMWGDDYRPRKECAR